MKCPYCGGSIIEDPGCYPHGPERKCMSCGRRVKDLPNQKESETILDSDPGREKMEPEKKTCIKCGKELPKTTDFFQKCSNTKDGFLGQCKTCRQKYMKNLRKGIRVRDVKIDKKPKPAARARRRKQASVAESPKGPDPVLVQVASPTEILIALRRGIASEIVDIIKEKYEL